MARLSAKTVLNRQALTQLDLVLAAGLEAAAVKVLERTRPPDAPPYGQGLPLQGGYVSYVDSKKVGGTPGAVKPRALRDRKGVTVAVGFGFPGRFQEMGTVNQPPRPFFTPVVMEVVGDSNVVATAVKAALTKSLSTLVRARA